MKANVPGARHAQRRCGGLDVGDARTRRDQAQIGMADRGRSGRADAAGCIDDRQRHAVAVKRLQALFDVAGRVNRLDDRLGIGTPALPVREGALRVGLDQADAVSCLNRRQRQANGKRAFA